MLSHAVEEYIVELLLLAGIFLASPLARLIADHGDYAGPAEKKAARDQVCGIFRIMFLGLLGLSLLLFH